MCVCVCVCACACVRVRVRACACVCVRVRESRGEGGGRGKRDCGTKPISISEQSTDISSVLYHFQTRHSLKGRPDRNPGKQHNG